MTTIQSAANMGTAVLVPLYSPETNALAYANAQVPSNVIQQVLRGTEFPQQIPMMKVLLPIYPQVPGASAYQELLVPAYMVFPMLQCSPHGMAFQTHVPQQIAAQAEQTAPTPPTLSTEALSVLHSQNPELATFEVSDRFKEGEYLFKSREQHTGYAVVRKTFQIQEERRIYEAIEPRDIALETAPEILMAARHQTLTTEHFIREKEEWHDLVNPESILHTDTMGRTAMHWLAMRGDFDGINLLLKTQNAHKTLLMKDKNGQTPLDLAKRHKLTSDHDSTTRKPFNYRAINVATKVREIDTTYSGHVRIPHTNADGSVEMTDFFVAPRYAKAIEILEAETKNATDPRLNINPKQSAKKHTHRR